MPVDPHPGDGPTTRIPLQPSEQQPAGPPVQPPRPPVDSPADSGGTEVIAKAAPVRIDADTELGGDTDSDREQRKFFRDPVALSLTAITLIALLVAGLIGAELIARKIADNKVAAAMECVVNDEASVSFGVSPPFLWQHITGNYTNISIHTAGNQVKEAKEMKADVEISDVRLHTQGDSGGTIGALDATVTWPASGIKDTIHQLVPLLGKFVSSVTTNAGDGTVELKGAAGLAGVTVKPGVSDGKFTLTVEKLSALTSITLPRESIQPALDEFIESLTSKYPLGLKADSVQVTDNGVIARFSTRNAAIPAKSKDPCFANL